VRRLKGINGLVAVLGLASGCLQPPAQDVSPPAAPPAASHSPAPQSAAEERERQRCLVDRADQILNLLAAGGFEDAAREIDGLAGSFPEYGPAQVVKGILQRRLQRATAPATPPPSEVARNSEDAAATLAEARRLVGAGRDGEAVERLEAARALDPGNPAVSGALADLLKKMGLERYSRGDSAQAVSCWKRALEARPGDPETLRFLERASAVNRKL